MNTTYSPGAHVTTPSGAGVVVRVANRVSPNVLVSLDGPLPDFRHFPADEVGPAPREDPMAYAPRPGDLVRDVDGEVWFVYADAADPTDLYAITTPYHHDAEGTPLETVTGKWGPLTLEFRPEEAPEEVIR